MVLEMTCRAGDLVSPQLQTKSLLQHAFCAKQPATVANSFASKSHPNKRRNPFFPINRPRPKPKPASQLDVFPTVPDASALRPTNSLRTFGKVRSLNSGSPSQERRNLSSYSIPKVPGHTLAETHLAGRADGVGSSRIGRRRGKRVETGCSSPP